MSEPVIGVVIRGKAKFLEMLSVRGDRFGADAKGQVGKAHARLGVDGDALQTSPREAGIVEEQLPGVPVIRATIGVTRLPEQHLRILPKVQTSDLLTCLSQKIASSIVCLGYLSRNFYSDGWIGQTVLYRDTKVHLISIKIQETDQQNQTRYRSFVFRP